jgi:NADP-dependent 3-hydroxy acid dehydrogenase YdfG
MQQAQDLGAALEEAGALADRLNLQSANALEAERRALAESWREIEVLTAAAGAEKDTALAALKARCALCC